MGASPDSPTFSVVIPTRGRASQLEGCLQAVARLDFPSERFEVVVVNDGGDPETDAVYEGLHAHQAALVTAD